MPQERWLGWSGLVLVASCAVSRPAPNLAYLSRWEGNTLHVCCDRDKGGPECDAQSWVNVVQDHCAGRARLLGEQAATSPARERRTPQCVIYACDEKVNPFVRGHCSPAGERVINVHVVVDPTFGKSNGWQYWLEKALQNANWYFQPFGISFGTVAISKAGLIGSKRSRRESFERLEAAKVAGPTGELHVGITGEKIQPESWGHDLLGSAMYLGDLVLLYAKDPETLGATLTHEFGHIFGADHTHDVSSVMTEAQGENPWVKGFDSLSTKIIRVTKCIDLKEGIVSLTAGQTRQLSAIIRSQTSKGTLHELTNNCLERSEQALEEKRGKEAVRWARRAAELQPDHPYVNLDLGEAYTEVDNFSGAQEAYARALAQESDARDLTFRPKGNVKERYPLRAFALCGLGYVFWQTKKLEDANRVLSEAIAVAPRYPQALRYLGYVALAQKDPVRALGYLRKAMEMDPDNEFGKKALAEAEQALRGQR